MRRLLSLFFLLFAVGIGQAYSQKMTDEQVVAYVKQAQAAGKSQKQMTTELLRRGVTQEQVLRIKEKFESTNSVVLGSDNIPTQMRKRTVDTEKLYETAGIEGQKKIIDEERVDESSEEADSVKIFGHNLFKTKNLHLVQMINS